VGKIYKPDLRRLATAVSVETEVARTLQAAGRAQDDPVFRVLADAQPDVAVEAGAGAPAPLIASLREALSRLPVKVDVRD
jgi:fatty-acyl-CoA synthase